MSQYCRPEGVLVPSPVTLVGPPAVAGFAAVVDLLVVPPCARTCVHGKASRTNPVVSLILSFIMCFAPGVDPVLPWSRFRTNIMVERAFYRTNWVAPSDKRECTPMEKGRRSCCKTRRNEPAVDTIMLRGFAWQRF